jgi:hypothetical protein
MQTIEATPADQRFLKAAGRLSASAWNNECQSVRAWLASSHGLLSDDERDEMLGIVTGPLVATEIPLAIVHCYAEVPEGTKWDVVFDPNDLNICQSTMAILRYGIVWHRAVSRTLAHGWHQVAVVDFPIGLPALLDTLPTDDFERASRYVGFCSADDFPDIKRTWNALP